jgi:hypothetical protein
VGAASAPGEGLPDLGPGHGKQRFNKTVVDAGTLRTFFFDPAVREILRDEQVWDALLSWANDPDWNGCLDVEAAKHMSLAVTRSLLARAGVTLGLESWEILS